MRSREFCVECGQRFGLVEPSEQHEETCVDCASRLGRIIGVCQFCDRAITSGKGGPNDCPCFREDYNSETIDDDDLIESV
jgi:hypothetical protein